MRGRGLLAFIGTAVVGTGLLTAVAIAPSASAAAFTPGNIVVTRVGTGSAALSNASTAVFLDEYTAGGVLVQSVALPTSAGGSQQPVTMSGSATSEGALALSADGNFLTLGGYGIAPGTASVAGTASAAVPRVIARVDGAGVVDSSTALSDAHTGNNIRGATSVDGTSFWSAGGAGGIRYSTLGSATSTQVTTLPANVRVPVLGGGQLYASSASGANIGVNVIGSGLPTTPGTTAGFLPGLGLSTPPSPYGFVFLDRDTTVAGADTLYVADDSGGALGGIYKFSFDGSTWAARGNLRPAGAGARGITGAVVGGSANLVVTTNVGGGSLVSVIDAAAFNAPIAAGTSTVATVATAPVNTAFRGVAFTPAQPVVNDPPTITVDPGDVTIGEGGSTTLGVTATGSAPLSFQWFQGSSGDTSTPVGTNNAGFTTPALTATTQYWVRVTNSVGSDDSATATVTVTVVVPGNTPPVITPLGVQAVAYTLSDGSPPAVRTVAVSDAESAVDALSVSVSSSNPAVATATVPGTGATRPVDVTPVGVGTATMTITVTDGELTASTSMAVAVSGGQPAGVLNHYGISDASAAVELGSGAMVVADDETNILRTYSRTSSGYPSESFDLRANGLVFPDPNVTRELDIEAGARTGDTIYWLASQGQNSSGNTRLNRRMLFTTQVGGATSTGPVSIGGSYQGLRDDLVAWDTTDGHGRGVDHYGLAAAANRAPESSPTGLNIEALTFAPGATSAYLGFRGPLAPGGKALILPVTNLPALVTANPTTGVTATFGAPIEVDLGGRGIRDIKKAITTDNYLILAGPSGATTGAAEEFRLYSWTGQPGDAPVLRSANLDALATNGSIESIVEVPDTLSATAPIQLITDSGDTIWYADGVIDKELVPAEFRKVTSNRIALGGFPACVGPVTAIGAVQGAGAASPIAGQSVTVRATVVGDYETTSGLRGFYVQDAGDGDPATSDGLFVFNNIGTTSPDLVSVGQVVEVTGPVSDFQDQTQITATTITTCGTATVTPADITLPVASATALEPYEGMLVRVPQTLTVTETFQLGRFGQVVVSSGGKLRQPTHLFDGGSPEAIALQSANNLNRLIIDDANNAQNVDPIALGRDDLPLSVSNPLRGGDTVTNPVGVLSYTWAGNAASGNAYRLRPVNALTGDATFAAANPRPAAAPTVGGTVQVAGANLLNLFNTFGTTSCSFGVGGAVAECRGASDAAEFERQIAKTVAELLALDAKIIGVNEIENDGYGPSSTLATLVTRLNAVAGPGTWAYIDVDAATGTLNSAGTDAIKVALLYQPAAVTPVPGTTATAFSAAATFERIPLAQTFSADGTVFSVVVNHFKSKSTAGCPTLASGDPDADRGDGQGCWNARRTAQANALLSFLGQVTATAGDPDVLVLGDLNSYAKEDPIQVLAAAGYVDLDRRFGGDDTYSYVFDGQWGYLDYALASSSLSAQVSGAAPFHLNSDEPSVLDYLVDFKSPAQQVSLYAPDQFRASDHDPVVVGLAPSAAPTITGAPPAGTVGVAYDFAFTVSGVPAATVSATSTVPAGLTLSSTGRLSGTPTQSGTFALTVSATNGVSPVAVSTVTLVIAPAAAGERIVYSTSSSRTAPVLLAGSTQPTGTNIYVFFEGAADVRRVVFTVDGGSPRVENTAPWDLKGVSSAGSAKALATGSLSAGAHTVRAVVTRSSGATAVIDATFTVQGAPAPAAPVIKFSGESDRDPAALLDGATLTGSTTYIFAEVTAATQVVFAVDGRTVKTEKNAPYDLAGSNAADLALPYSLTRLSSGPHTVTATATFPGGQRSVGTATFNRP